MNRKVTQAIRMVKPPSEEDHYLSGNDYSPAAVEHLSLLEPAPHDHDPHKKIRQERLTIVLFICVHNSCRSQMAEAIFNDLAPEGMRAISAGSEPAREVDPLALVALKEMGIDTNALSPKLLTREAAKGAYRIVTMGCPEACPAVGKPMEDWEIEAPSGRNIEEYRKVREIIRDKVERLLQALGSGQTGNAADEGKRRAAT